MDKTIHSVKRPDSPIPPLLKPKYYYVQNIIIHWKNGQTMEVSDVSDIEEKSNLVTFVFDDRDDDKPERMINKNGIVKRHHRSGTFNTDYMSYWEITESNLKINEDGE